MWQNDSQADTFNNVWDSPNHVIIVVKSTLEHILGRPVQKYNTRIFFQNIINPVNIQTSQNIFHWLNGKNK